MSDQPETTRHPRPPDPEFRSLTAALAQAAHDAKDVGLGVLASAAYDQIKPKPPAQDK